MLIIALLIMFITTLYLVFRRKDILSLYMMLICISFLLMFLGVITTIAKSGGYSISNLTFLFLDKRIQTTLQNMPITLGIVGYAVAIGRTLFPYFLLLLSIECSMISILRRNKRKLIYLLAILPTLYLIYYYPPIFKTIVTGRFNLLVFNIYMARVWIVLYIVVAFSLLLFEYFSITIKSSRKEFRSIVLGMIGLTSFYGMYAIQDPAQIYNMFIHEYISIGSLTYINKALGNFGYLSIISFIILFLVVGNIGLIQYTNMSYLEYREDIVSKKKFDNRSMGVSVFAHSLKNQILASKVMDRRMERALKEEEIDKEKLFDIIEKQKSLHNQMINHINSVYKTIKPGSIHLTTNHLSEIIGIGVSRFLKNGYDVNFKLDFNFDTKILADKEQLGEAIYQLLCNSAEADSENIQMVVEKERLYYVITIIDDGSGIEKKNLKKIFEPFQTYKSSNENWGLGLYYIRHVVRGHYGKINIESTLNEGTEVQVMLPKYLEKNE